MSDPASLARADIRGLQPYQHAAWKPTLERLHANEMPWRAQGDESALGLNRYPEPQPPELIGRLADLYGVRPEQLIAGRGSDEGIDLLVRVFCRAEHDSVVICPPTFGMYKVCTKIQGAALIEIPLLKEEGFALDTEQLLNAWRPGVKLYFLCSPNNPTGNLLDVAAIERLCRKLDDKALIVVDEAYIEFARQESLTRLLSRYANLAILRTLSKAYALAGARCGAVIAHPDVIGLMARVIPPYALPVTTVQAVMQFTSAEQQALSQQRISMVLAERAKLSERLRALTAIRRVWWSDTNYLLVECVDANQVLQAAQSVGLIIRDQRSQPMLANCLRITVGTPEQNERLLRGIASSVRATA
jgi:histidinol-phosphate aminotransferase